MDRVEIVACRSNGEGVFSGLSSNSQMEKMCLDFRGSLQYFFPTTRRGYIIACDTARPIRYILDIQLAKNLLSWGI
jgi:hypothetical protein